MPMDVLGPMMSLGFMLVFGAVSLVGIVFWIIALVDCTRKEFPGDNMKVVWILIIILAGWVGALVYWFVGRPTGIDQGVGPGQHG